MNPVAVGAEEVELLPGEGEGDGAGGGEVRPIVGQDIEGLTQERQVQDDAVASCLDEVDRRSDRPLT